MAIWGRAVCPGTQTRIFRISRGLNPSDLSERIGKTNAPSAKQARGLESAAVPWHHGTTVTWCHGAVVPSIIMIWWVQLALAKKRLEFVEAMPRVIIHTFAGLVGGALNPNMTPK